MVIGIEGIAINNRAFIGVLNLNLTSAKAFAKALSKADANITLVDDKNTVPDQEKNQADISITINRAKGVPDNIPAKKVGEDNHCKSPEPT